MCVQCLDIKSIISFMYILINIYLIKLTYVHIELSKIGEHFLVCFIFLQIEGWNDDSDSQCEDEI